MNITAEKNEIIQWIDSLDNPSIIERIKMIKKEEQSFHFDKEWEKGVSVSEARKSTKEFLSSLPWKK